MLKSLAGAAELGADADGAWRASERFHLFVFFFKSGRHTLCSD